MIEIPDNKPSYSLIVPVEYDVVEDPYKITGNWMSDLGLISASRVYNLGLSHIFNPKDPETGKLIDSLRVFQRSLPSSNLAIVLYEILKQNEITREGIEKNLGERLFKEIADKKGTPWRHVFHLPKTQLLDGRPEFNEFVSVKPELYRTMVAQGGETTVLRIKEDTCESLFNVTRLKIQEIFEILGTNPEKTRAEYVH